MAKNSLTLQINSLEALEKLIGGDTQVELDIRNNIVQAFAEKHLKAMAGTSQINTAISTVRCSVENEIKAELKKQFGEYADKWRYDIKLNEEVKEVIRKTTKENIGTFVKEYVIELLSDTENLKTQTVAAMRRTIVNEVMSDWRIKIVEAVKNEIESQAKNLKLTFNISKGE
jgi:transcriptional regulator CtsR